MRKPHVQFLFSISFFGGSYTGRGAQAQTQQLTDQQLAGINMLNKQLLGNQQQLGNPLAPQFQNTANNSGLSPADLRRIARNAK